MPTLHIFRCIFKNFADFPSLSNGPCQALQRFSLRNTNGTDFCAVPLSYRGQLIYAKPLHSLFLL